MKNFLIRLAIYIPIISFLWSIFVPDFFDPMNLRGSFLEQLPAYIIYYGITYGVWIVAYELVYRAATAIRKEKPQPVPETNRLDIAQDVRGIRFIKEWDGNSRHIHWRVEKTEQDGTQHFSRPFRFKWLARWHYIFKGP